MGKIELGDFGTWLGAIGTVLAVIFAWWSGHREATKYRVAEEQSQAEQIACWIAAAKEPLPIKLSNNSHEPVYDVIISIVFVQGAGPQNGIDSLERKAYKVLPPGEFKTSFDFHGWDMHKRPGVEIAFTDKRSQSWVKDKNGKLTKLKSTPSEYYKLPSPFDWGYLDDDI